MSNYIPKPNTGSLFRNDKASDTHPDYRGSLMVEGFGDLWLSAWINEKPDGSKYMSIKCNKKEDQARPAQRNSASSESDDPF